MNRSLRIGTRDSELALWQARTVQEAMAAQGAEATLVPVKSTGDLILDKPLYELGVTGIFTKTLDIALLNGSIDLAVHSMKDVPTALPEGIVPVAVLERANPMDILVHKGLDFLNAEGIVATGSLRRKAQWLRRYPLHEVVDLRGNVNTRLQKLEDNRWDGAVFAAAGLERIGLLPQTYTTLEWMVPAPAQGAMLVVARADDAEAAAAAQPLHHAPTDACVRAERAFLRELEGGCTAPIGALAQLKARQLDFTGALFSLDGTREVRVAQSGPAGDPETFGIACAREILENGGAELMQEIRKTLS